MFSWLGELGDKGATLVFLLLILFGSYSLTWICVGDCVLDMSLSGKSILRLPIFLCIGEVVCTYVGETSLIFIFN